MIEARRRPKTAEWPMYPTIAHFSWSELRETAGGRALCVSCFANPAATSLPCDVRC